jgi:GntR family transcriptional regulator/MocR family aminotransferase
VREPSPKDNLRQGRPDAASFRRTAWVASTRRALSTAPNDAFGPGDPQGRPELRRALADCLARARGVRTDPDRIVVCAGTGPALRLVFNGVLPGPVAVESYGLPFHRSLLPADSVPLPLDDHGARVDALGRVATVVPTPTPAHQFPDRRSAARVAARGGDRLGARHRRLGRGGRLRRRVALRPAAGRRHAGPRPGSGAVPRVGEQEPVPTLRLGWMVLPDHLVDRVLAAKGEREAWTGVTDQLTLADFVELGSYDRHLRRMRQRYRARRDVLVERAPHIRVTGIAAGPHALLELPTGTEQSVVKAATWQGLALDGLTAFRHPAATMPAVDGLVVGYATPPDHAYRAAADALCRILP